MKNRLFMLPGLAADEKLFSYIDNANYELVVPQWLSPNEKESLEEYGQRWSESFDFKEGDIIGGMSFGGQVALELAKHLNFAAVILISSHRSHQEISDQFRVQQRLLQNLPETAVRVGLKSVGIPTLNRQEGLKPIEVKWLQEMVDRADFNFLRWSAWAAANWKYSFSKEDFQMPVYQVHGEHDPIIKIPDYQDCFYIKGAKHLINYTHPEEIKKWLGEKLAVSL